MHTCILAPIAIAPPLTAPYDGPYKVVARSGRVNKILMKGKVETVSLDRVKLAHLECEPTTGTNIQHTTPNKQQSSKTTRISDRNPQGHLDLVVRTLRRPTGRMVKRKSRRQSEAVANWPRSHSN